MSICPCALYDPCNGWIRNSDVIGTHQPKPRLWVVYTEGGVAEGEGNE